MGRECPEQVVAPLLVITNPLDVPQSLWLVHFGEQYPSSAHTPLAQSPLPAPGTHSDLYVLPFGNLDVGRHREREPTRTVVHVPDTHSMSPVLGKEHTSKSFFFGLHVQ